MKIKKISLIALLSLTYFFCCSNSQCKFKRTSATMHTAQAAIVDSSSGEFYIKGKFKVGESYLYICDYKDKGQNHSSHIYILDKDSTSSISVNE